MNHRVLLAVLCCLVLAGIISILAINRPQRRADLSELSEIDNKGLHIKDQTSSSIRRSSTRRGIPIVSIKEAQLQVESKGDYRAIRDILDNSTEGRRFELLYGMLGRVRSGGDLMNDVQSQLGLIEDFGGRRAPVIKDKLFKDLGLRLVGEKKWQETADFQLEDWKSVVKGAVSANPRVAFEMLSEVKDEKRLEAGVKLGVTSWLNSDSIGASEFIGALPEGQMKRIAIAELVHWLRLKGDKDAAAAWETPGR
jgi:hypothetical protein